MLPVHSTTTTSQDQSLASGLHNEMSVIIIQQVQLSHHIYSACLMANNVALGTVKSRLVTESV